MRGETQRGKLYLIGAGPGDPELLTIKAARVLALCDVVLYDRLVTRPILDLARPDAELIYVGKRTGEHEPRQQEILDLLASKTAEGKIVGRLKGGDPFVFGRGAEEWMFAVEHGIDVEIVPGVTSATSLPALAGIPVTYRGLSQSFTVITGHCSTGHDQHWAKYAEVDTIVILMGVTNRAFIAQQLIQAGRDPSEPVAFIERGTTPSERVILADLASVAQEKIDVRNPAVFVIGKVVSLRAQLLELAAVAGSSKPLTP